MFLVLVRLLNNRCWAFIASVLWATHPTHVEAISYISGTADPMGLLFFFVGLWIMPFHSFKENWKSLFGAWICFVLSILSKEAMIVVPALLILVLALKNPKQRWTWKTYIPTLPFWATAGIYMLLRKTLLNFNDTYSFFKTSNIYTENMIYRAYTYLATLPEYVEILFYPINLHMERQFPVHTNLLSSPVLLGLALMVVTLVLSLFALIKWEKDWPLFSWLWFFGAFVPMMGVLVPVNSFILEHWLYLPSVGFFIVLARVFYLGKSQLPTISKGLVALACVYFAVFTHIRNKDWRTPISFYTNILEYSDGSARVHNNIAMAYSEKKIFAKAIQHYLKAIEKADAYPQTHYNLARAYIQLQKYDKAIEHLHRSLQINPNFHYASELLVQLNQYLKQNQ